MEGSEEVLMRMLVPILSMRTKNYFEFMYLPGAELQKGAILG